MANCTSQGCTCRCKSCGSAPYGHCRSHGNGCHLSCESRKQRLADTGYRLLAAFILAAALTPIWMAARVQP